MSKPEPKIESEKVCRNCCYYHLTAKISWCSKHRQHIKPFETCDKWKPLEKKVGAE